MKIYIIRCEATFSFTIPAESEEAAKNEARSMLSSRDPVTCGKFRLGYDDPFIAVARIDEGIPSLEAELEFEEDEDGMVKL